MKELFGVPKLKADGTPGKLVELPPVQELQENPMTRTEYRDACASHPPAAGAGQAADAASAHAPSSRALRWIEYSVYDAQGTWLLHEELVRRLKEMPWDDQGQTMYDFYRGYWAPFGALLTDMERNGIKVRAMRMPCASSSLSLDAPARARKEASL